MTSTDVSVRRVYLGEVHARVSTVGTGGERPFLLVPGIGVSANYFERLAPELNEFGPVHALDLPGFGGVPHPRNTRMTIRDYADLVGQVIDELGLNDPVILGHSMGTQIVADLASRRQELSSIVLIGPVINRRERHVLTAARRFAQSSVHETPKVAVLATGAYLLCGIRWFSRILPEMMQYRIEETAPRIRASTLVIRGEFDALCPRQWTDEIAELIPRSRAWEIPGAAHSVMHGHAEAVARLCVDHARLPAGATVDVALVRYSDDEHPGQEQEPAEAPAPGNTAKAVQGRVTELIGILADDDALIAEGKTMHAESMERHASPDTTGPQGGAGSLDETGRTATTETPGDTKRPARKKHPGTGGSAGTS